MQEEGANSVDTDQTPQMRRLIWFYTVCSGLSVQIFWIKMIVYISWYNMTIEQPTDKIINQENDNATKNAENINIWQ